MKLIILFTFIVMSLNSFAETGMEKNSTPKEEKYLYSPLNHLQTTISVGPTYFRLGGDLDSDFKPGAKLGVVAEAGQGFAYLIGLNYLMIRAEYTYQFIEVEDTLNYLSLVLGFKYYVAGSNTWFYLRGNLDPSILVNSDNNSFKDFDLLTQFGLGVMIPGSTSFNIDLGFTMGLLDISEVNNVSTNNEGLTLSFGLTF